MQAALHATLATATLVLALSSNTSADDGGSGPPVGDAFAAATFDALGQPESIFVAWRDDQAQLHSGLVRLDDDSFDAFPVLPSPEGSVTNLAVGVGGPPDDRRAYVAWVGNQLDLWLIVFDDDGTVVTPPQIVTKAVQVVPLRFAALDTGALISYSWGAHPNWDPRVLHVDLAGTPLSEEVAENASAQTLGVDVAASTQGPFGVVYMKSSPGPGSGAPASLRRFGSGAFLEPPVGIPENFGLGAYWPSADLAHPSDLPPFLFLAIPDSSSGVADTRFVTTRLTPSPVTVGPLLSELSPTFVGPMTDVAVLTGVPNLAVAIWQEVELQDPCLCSIPPPVRVEVRAQALEISDQTPVQASGPAFTVHLWEEGDAWSAPLTPPVIAASARTTGEFTVLWTDGVLRWVRTSVLPIGSPFCFGVACPCGNDDVQGGCANSTGSGAVLSGSGGTSVSADDLVLRVTGIPSPDANGLFFMGPQAPAPFVPASADGLACIGGDLRFPGILDDNTPPDELVQAHVVSTAAAGGVVIGAGETRNFQGWFRDNDGSPCGGASNLSNAFAVTFTP